MGERVKVGDGVLVTIGFDADGEPIERPALVVRSWHHSSDLVNVQIFLDGANDAGRMVDGRLMFTSPEVVAGLAWRTSLHRGSAVMGWRRS